MKTLTRPALRYMGGKWRLAPWIIHHFPPHRVYLEPFGGAASVLLQKQRSYAEIYNDLDGSIVNVFRVLQNAVHGAELVRRLEVTPFARAEFELSYELSNDPIENARRTIVRSFMGHGATAIALRRKTGFRADSNRSGSTSAHDWARLPPALALITERFGGVVIENRPAMSLIDRFDSADTLHYLDPPYMHHSRSRKRVKGELEHAYAHEMSDGEHEEMLARIVGLEGMVVLSGYRSDLYDRKLSGWYRVEKAVLADGARRRVEVLWLNDAAASRMTAPLFPDSSIYEVSQIQN